MKIRSDLPSKRHERTKFARVISQNENTHTRRLVKMKLEEDSIDHVHRFAGVFNAHQHSKAHQGVPVDQLPRVTGIAKDLNFNSSHCSSPADE